MSAIKPIIREVKQSVLKGFAHAKDKLHQLADNLTQHVDDVAIRVRGQDRFDGAPDAPTPLPPNRFRTDDRTPENIFADGFRPRDPSRTDLEQYVLYNVPSNFVGTSKDPTLYLRPPIPTPDPGYRYVIQDPGNGVDVNQAFPNNPYASEFEVAYPGGIPTEFIVGAQRIGDDRTSLGDFIPNPNFQGVR
ncbi:scabin-related ADP-ribosyltransferase [Microbacterium sp. SA39]|uniref:scabin-related ADP-ribosyltransferase n=1 Tax=Microbacterium sp. SA39 TaxID=1263625 RepID=UPI00061EFBEC|nr:hypothetical protein [Microbacterium sp. SA39]KJQ53315.1 hypothetical protein RS85_02829 [Microbacterium sp. SA39]